MFVDMFVGLCVHSLTCWSQISLKTDGDRGLVLIDHQLEMAYGESNGHVIDAIGGTVHTWQRLW